MKMTETNNQEKYILLNNDSDLEEFDKSKVSLMHQTQKGKLFSRSHKIKKFSSSEKLQRLCHTFFVLLILISQIFLGFIVLKTHQDLNALKQKGASANIKASFNPANEQRDVETINSRKEQTESEFKDLKQQELASIKNIICKNTEEQPTSVKNTETGISKDKNQQLQNPVGSKMNAFEKRLENVTTTLNNLQNHLQEDLNDIYLQLSEFKDNICVLENTLTKARMEDLNSYTESTTQPIQENEKTGYSSGLPYITPSQNYDISDLDSVSVPFINTALEPTSQNPTDAENIEILEEKPKIIISFIKNLTDLQIFFYGADSNANGYLTYHEIESLLGEETPEQEQLELFDADHNQMYSYAELIRAFGLTE